jgi:hypothetical protein
MANLSSALPLHRAGVIVKMADELRFLPAQAVRRFVPPPPLSDVSGTALTMALVDGQVLAIIAVGPRGAALTVCEVGGEQVGLIGADPVEVGFFETDGAGVAFRGRRVSALDVAELVHASARSAVEQAEVET